MEHYRNEIRTICLNPERAASAAFRKLVLYVSIDELKTFEHFETLKKNALMCLLPQDVFNETAIGLIRTKNLANLKFLIDECQFDFKEMRKEGKSLLHEACVYGDVSIVKYLLEKQYDANAKDHEGLTPLHFVSGFQVDVSLVDLLKDYGANLDERNTVEWTPLHMAAIFQNQEKITALEKAGANQELTWHDSKYGQLNYKKTLLLAKTRKIIVEKPKRIPHNDDDKSYSDFFKGIFQTKLDSNLFHGVWRSLAKKSMTPQQINFFFLSSYILSEPFNPNKYRTFLTDNVIKKFGQKYIYHASFMLARSFIKQQDQVNAKNLTDILYGFFIKTDFKSPEHKLLSKGEDLNAICNEIIFLYNKTGFLNKGLELFKKVELLLPKTNNPLVLAELFYTVAIAKHECSLNPAAGYEYHKKAFELNKNDNYIFRNYYNHLVLLGKYNELLACCELSTSTLTTKYSKYAHFLLGNIKQKQFNEFIEASIKEDERVEVVKKEDASSEVVKKERESSVAVNKEEEFLDKNSDEKSLHRFISYEFKATCDLNSENYGSGLKANEMSFAIAEQRYQQDPIENSLGSQIMVRLNYYLHDEKYQEAWVFMQETKTRYPLEYSATKKLCLLEVILFSKMGKLNQIPKLIEQIKLLEDYKESLSDLYCSLAIDEILLRQDHKQAIVYLDAALTTQPNNLKAAVIKIILLPPETSLAESEADDLDPDFIESLISHEINESQDFSKPGHYDPVAVHQFFENQNKKLLSNLEETLFPQPKPRSQWALPGGKVLTQESQNLILIKNDFYNPCYAFIDEGLKTDAFQQGLEKGFCKRARENHGIKFLKKSLFELKIEGDARLYTKNLYKNSNGDYLIIFNKEANHEEIKRLVSKKKPLNMIELENPKIPCQFEQRDVLFSPPKIEKGTTTTCTTAQTSNTCEQKIDLGH